MKNFMSSPANINNDIRTIKLFSVLILLAVSMTAVQTSFAQQGQVVEIADAFTLKEKKSTEVLRYKGMPELSAPLPKLNYPEKAVEMAVEGRVIVSYTINEEGKVVHAVVKRGIGYGCDEEALRVIKNASFKPVMDKDGNPTTRTFTTPLSFRLQ